MFEFHEDDGRYYSMHHPFTSPLDEDVSMLERAVNGETQLFAGLRAKAYDAVINGVEVAGGSIRIHRRDVQAIVFKALGMSEETARARFGFFLDALAYGTPPHGGIASGIERTLMVLVPTENIRDVMAFPKTASAQDLMIDAPGEVDQKQLAELHLRIAEHRPHEPFNEEVFRRLVDEALADLPLILLDQNSSREEKEIAVLERLLEKVTRHCGIIEGFKFEDLTDHPRKIQVLQRIVGIVDFDSVHEHPSSVSFRKQPIIKEYVDKALGN